MNCKQEVSKIVEFIRETVKDAGAKGVVLGLSGGLDSAVVYKLCVRALGKDNIITMYMPDIIYNSDINIPLIKRLIHTTYLHEFTAFCEDGLRYPNMITNIDRISKSIMRRYDYQHLDKLIIGNIKSRSRMIMLYTYSNNFNMLVIGTTNKSEHLIGYFTKYGDGGVDFEPIQHLYKTDIYKLAKYLKVPQEIIDKKPSADLWEGQTDEDEIGMSYDRLDMILKCIEHEKISPSIDFNKLCLLKGITEDEFGRVCNMIKASKHKRRLPRCLESIS